MKYARAVRRLWLAPLRTLPALVALMGAPLSLLSVATDCCADDGGTHDAPLTDAGANESASSPDAGAAPWDVTAAPPFKRPALTYLQYGIAFTAEATFAAGPICSGSAAAPCIFGSGGGIAARLGKRWGEIWYLGGAYEMSKHDSGTLYRLGILQQLRAEVRRYFPTDRDTQPFVTGSLGLVSYGNEWAVSEWGIAALIGGGLEAQIMNGPLVGFSLGYRPIFFGRFQDSSGLSHAPGFAQLVTVELTLEGRDRR